MSDTEQQIEDRAERPAGASQDAPAAAQGVAGAADQEHGGPEPERDALQGDVEELVQALAKRDEYLALAQRTQADFENYRKRVAKEALAAQKKGAAKLARELLPALDNLDRALEAAAEEDPLLDGVKLVRGELHAALARAGIESFSPKGERFDPTEHEAMAQQPVDGVDGGLVAEVYQPGYRMGDEVIRPARVLVAA
ncbi:MAG TPA: nucleotide exchange factor GrpE [Solirubrobacteraceae bacterium]|jgi:molecular chaperone GrpE|nr:nucleotide exchange factor GrpE [Solirubrobacteraceae bacterium]